MTSCSPTALEFTTPSTVPSLTGRNISTFNNKMCRPTSETQVFVVIYGVIICVVVIGNLLIIVTFLRNVKLRTVTNYFFVSLAVSDILVGTISIPMWIYFFVSPTFNGCVLPGRHFLVVYRFFDIFSALASTAHLVAISFERSMAITIPIRHRTCPKQFFHALILIAWLYGLITSVIFVIDLSTSWVSYRAIVLFIAGFVLPLLIITSMYTLTYRSVKSFIKRRRLNSINRVTQLVYRERKTAITVAIVTGLFVIAWLPFFTVSLVFRFCKSCNEGFSPFNPIIDFVKILHFSNSGVNPFIYTWRNVEWRKTLVKMLFPCIKVTALSSTSRKTQGVGQGDASGGELRRLNHAGSPFISPKPHDNVEKEMNPSSPGFEQNQTKHLL